MESRRPSRLSRNLEKQSKKQFYLSFAAIIIILIVFFKFGLPILGEVGSFVSSIGGNEEESSGEIDKIPLLPPQLDPLPEATDKQEIAVSGNAPVTQGEIEIYLNNTLEDRVTLKNSNTFESSMIRLRTGENTIKARVTDGKKTSDFSNEITISYFKDKPKLEVSSPQDGQVYKREDKNIQVSGKTDADNTVTVNELIAVVDGQGNFSYTLSLKDGENEIKIIAENPAGVIEEKIIKVKYEP